MAAGWEPAKAEVLARRDSKKFAMSSMPTRSRYEYAMEITPPGSDDCFSATMITPMMVDRWTPLNEGDVVTVLWRTGTEEVKWDRKEPSTSRKAQLAADRAQIKHTQDEAFEEALRKPHSPKH